ncbi:MAG: hypothetical protein GY699_06420, partial [Desulfobacteraceae bacterium]|nr:hypothetical protein [Desulfobacteraceae bacterium]
RLADYPWSSYPFYAYRKKQPSWLTTDLILSRITAKDRPSAYRRKVQTYSDEKGNIWEDVKHGLVYGSQDFLDQLKEKFLNDHKDAELPQHNRLLQSSNPEKLAAQAARAFGLDLSSICNTRRIAVHEKKQRDMLIYFLWETGQLSNQRIAELVGLTYSSISRRVSLFRENLDKDNNLKLRYVELKSQIKV